MQVYGMESSTKARFCNKAPKTAKYAKNKHFRPVN